MLTGSINNEALNNYNVGLGLTMRRGAMDFTKGRGQWR